jgi:hypothetical protein
MAGAGQDTFSHSPLQPKLALPSNIDPPPSGPSETTARRIALRELQTASKHRVAWLATRGGSNRSKALPRIPLLKGA